MDAFSILKKIYIYIEFINLFHIKIYVIHFEGLFTHLTGPCVTQDSSHVNGGVCHNGVIVEFLFGLIPVFQLWKDVEKLYGLITTLPSIIFK